MVDLKKLVEEYEICFAVDRSGSMDIQDVPDGEPVKAGFLGFGGTKATSYVSRWDAAGQAIANFVQQVEAIDTDGLDIVFFGGTIEHFGGQTAQGIVDLFNSLRTNGATPLAEGLTRCISALAGSRKPKKMIVVYTDGTPNSKQAARDVIVAQANSQKTKHEMTILFIQVGYDSGATTFLRELDDDLKGAKFDIVDAKTAEEAKKFGSVAELIAHAIND